MNENKTEQKEEIQENIPSISIQDIHKSYGKKEVLKGLSLEIQRGELFGLIGRNGIGKSTTIDCLIGAKKFDSGNIYIEGYDVKKDTLECKARIGYVSSEPLLYEEMTGLDYLDFIGGIYDISVEDFNKNVNYLTKRLELSEDDLHHYTGEYSHGMKQKLCLIASLIHNPDIWILDEPTVGLDIIAIEELKKMMVEYTKHGKTVLLTSHNIDMVSRLCDRVAIINKGVVSGQYDLVKQPNRRLQLPKLFVETYSHD